MSKPMIILCLVLGCFSSIQAQSLLFEDSAKRAVEARVDRETWNSFTTRTEMLEATAVDAEELASMPTHVLARLVLDWPLYGDLYAFNSLQLGMERLIQDYNALGELISREDAGFEMLRLYEGIDPSRATTFETLADQGTFTLQLAFLETLMAHPSVLAHMSSSERGELLRASVDKYHTVNNHLDLYSDLNLNAIGLLMGRTLRMESPQSLSKATNRADWLDSFLDGRDVISREAVAVIVDQTENLLNR